MCTLHVPHMLSMMDSPIHAIKIRSMPAAPEVTEEHRLFCNLPGKERQGARRHVGAYFFSSSPPVSLTTWPFSLM